MHDAFVGFDIGDAIGGRHVAAGIDDGCEKIVARETRGDPGPIRPKPCGAGMARDAGAIAEQDFASLGVSLIPDNGLEQPVPVPGILTAAVKLSGQRRVRLLKPREYRLVSRLDWLRILLPQGKLLAG